MYGLDETGNLIPAITQDEIAVLMQGERRKPCNNCATYEASMERYQDAFEQVCEILESIAKRPDLPNPERDADWENCMKWSSYNAKQCLQIAAPYRKGGV